MNKTNQPCALLVNDIHISKDNITEFKINWNEVLMVCDQYNIKNIFVGGDLFQSRSAQTLDILLAIHDALIAAERQNRRVILANGNHDKVNQEEIRGYCHIFDQHPNVQVIDHYLPFCEKDWKFALHVIPYFPENGSFSEKLDLCKKKLHGDKLNYLYIHEGINGVLTHASETKLPGSMFRSFDKTFVGHYHNRCVIPETNIEYIGASRQHNFGEDEEKGYTILYMDGNYEFFQNQKNIRYTVLDVDLEEGEKPVKEIISEKKKDGRYKIKVRVHTSPSKSSQIDKNDLILSGATKVEILTTEPSFIEHIPENLFEKFDSTQLKRAYQKFCAEKEIQDITLGITYLSKIQNHVEIN